MQPGLFKLQTLLDMKPFKPPVTIRNNRKGCIETRTFYLGLLALHYAPFLTARSRGWTRQ